MKMDDSMSRKKSLRKNLRSSYKCMLDPFIEDKYGTIKGDDNILKSLGLQSNQKVERVAEGGSSKVSSPKGCLFPSYSNRNSNISKSPKHFSIRGRPKSPKSLSSHSPTVSKVSLKKPDIDVGSPIKGRTVSVLKERSVSKEPSIDHLKILNDSREPVVKLEKCSVEKSHYYCRSVGQTKKDEVLNAHLSINLLDKNIEDRGPSDAETSQLSTVSGPTVKEGQNSFNDCTSSKILHWLSPDRIVSEQVKSSLVAEDDLKDNQLHSERIPLQKSNNESSINHMTLGKVSDDGRCCSLPRHTNEMDQFHETQLKEDLRGLSPQDSSRFKSLKLFKSEKKVSIAPISPSNFGSSPSPVDVDSEKKKVAIVNRRKSILKEPSRDQPKKFVIVHHAKPKVRISPPELSNSESGVVLGVPQGANTEQSSPELAREPSREFTLVKNVNDLDHKDVSASEKANAKSELASYTYLNELQRLSGESSRVKIKQLANASLENLEAESLQLEELRIKSPQIYSFQVKSPLVKDQHLTCSQLEDVQGKMTKWETSCLEGMQTENLQVKSPLLESQQAEGPHFKNLSQKKAKNENQMRTKSTTLNQEMTKTKNKENINEIEGSFSQISNKTNDLKAKCAETLNLNANIYVNGGRASSNEFEIHSGNEVSSLASPENSAVNTVGSESVIVSKNDVNSVSVPEVVQDEKERTTTKRSKRKRSKRHRVDAWDSGSFKPTKAVKKTDVKKLSKKGSRSVTHGEIAPVVPHEHESDSADSPASPASSRTDGSQVDMPIIAMASSPDIKKGTKLNSMDVQTKAARNKKQISESSKSSIANKISSRKRNRTSNIPDTHSSKPTKVVKKTGVKLSKKNLRSVTPGKTVPVAASEPETADSPASSRTDGSQVDMPIIGMASSPDIKEDTKINLVGVRTKAMCNKKQISVSSESSPAPNRRSDRKRSKTPSDIQDVQSPKRRKIVKKTDVKLKKKCSKSVTISVVPYESEPADSPASSRADGSQVDMPIIAMATSPNSRESENVRPQEDEESELIADRKEMRGQKRTMKDPSTRKKRGRKRIKVADSKCMKERATATTASESPKKARKKNQRRTGKRFSVTGNWYIAAGYLNDIINLLEEFESIDSWRFRDFARCWQNKAFSLVYRGRQTFKELLEFSEEIALLTKRFLSPPHSIKRRIGALYTLYGLYHKFPLGRLQFSNLRFELQEYKDLLELIQPFRSNIENPDPAFIVRKLELEGAILHCATACEPCYDFHNEERDYVELEYGKQRLAKSSAVNIAIPKVQLRADSDLLHHYHSIKTKVTGDENNPEKALSMITPEFLGGISSSLMQLRQDTLRELGMLEETSDQTLTMANGEGVICGKPSQADSLDVLVDDVLHSVDRDVMDTVNNGVSGQRSQKAIEKNQVSRDQMVKDFMRPPTAEDLKKPLRLQNKYAKQTKTKKPKISYSMEWKENVEKNSSNEGTEPDGGRVLLDIESEPPEYQELKEVLLPQPLPLKKKRGRKRPAALLKAASYSPRQRAKQQQQPNPPIIKTLTDNYATTEIPAENISVSGVSQASATRLLASELPDAKPAQQEDATTVIKVRMKADGVRKTVKLKVKVSLEQFKEMQKNSVRYANFKNKLKPLIKATQQGENKHKEWVIEDIDVQEKKTHVTVEREQEVGNEEQPPVLPPPPPSPLKPLPLRERFECLKYSDDDMDDDDDDDIPRKRKTEEEKDGNFDPSKVEEEEEDILEYEDGGIDDEDEDWEQEDAPRHYWRRRRRRRRWDGTWDEERGPRDSDHLLQPRTENKSVSMVPMRIGNTVRYFPMIKTNANMMKPKEVSSVSDEEPLQSDPVDSLFTWNDFSSDTSPPFKRRRRSSNAFTYIFSPRPRLRPKKLPNQLREKSPRSSPLPKTKETKVKKLDETDESNRNPSVAVEAESKTTDSIPLLETPIKKEAQAMLQELADEWEEDTFYSTSTAEPQTNDNTGETNVVSNFNDVKNHVQEDSNEVVFDDIEVQAKPEPEPEIEIDADAINVTDFRDDDVPDASEQLDSSIQVLNDAEKQDRSTNPVPYPNDSYSEGTEILPEVTEILPDLSLPVNSVYENNIQVIPIEVDRNLSLGMSSEALLPGTFLIDDTVASPQLDTLDQNTLPNAQFPSSQNLNVDLLNADSKQPLYYKMTATDGNDIFIPVSSLSQIGSKKIEILAFDVADVKPLFPTKSPPPINQPSISDPSSSFLHHTSPLQSHSGDETPPQPPPSFPTLSPSSVEQKHLPTCLNEPSSDSKPSCSFLFSPKLNSLRHLSTAIGKASGKPPSPEKPKVKFLFKGFLKSGK